MTKRWRRVVIVIAVVLGAFMIAAMVLTRRQPGFAESISFLAGKKGGHNEQIVDTPIFSPYPGTTSMTAQPYLWATDSYILDEPFDSLNERAKKELKSRANSASFYPTKKPTFQLYTFIDPKTKSGVSVSIAAQSKTQTAITVTEYREASWMDKAKNWVHNLFAPPKKPDPWTHY